MLAVLLLAVTCTVSVPLQRDGLDAPLLQPRAYVPIPIRDTAASGWLLEVLRTQADGLNGALDKFWPQVEQSGWIGYSPAWPEEAGGERATYWLNGHAPLHHLLANSDPTAPEVASTGASVKRYLDYIIAHQDPVTGWLGPGIGVEDEAMPHHPVPDYAHHNEDIHDLGGHHHHHDHGHHHDSDTSGTSDTSDNSNPTGGSDTYWARYYLLMTFAIEAEATTNVTESARMVNVMLKHIHASDTKMKAENWPPPAPQGEWSVYRVQEYHLVLQWLVDYEHTPKGELPFLAAHMAHVQRASANADWENWFDKWNNANCKNPNQPLNPLPPPPAGYTLFKKGVFCCDQTPCVGGHSTFLATMGGLTFEQCTAQCTANPKCHYVTAANSGACFLEEYCNTTNPFVLGPQPGGEVNTYARSTTLQTTLPAPSSLATPATAPAAPSTAPAAAAAAAVERSDGDTVAGDGKARQGQRQWPYCGMTSHGVNTAQALKTAAVLWRFSGNETLRQLSNTRMASVDEKFGVATGLICADESLCGEPWNPVEAARKSPSRGTEMCSVVESMFSYNEMFSILGGVADADRAERIAVNALPATWASPVGGEMWAHQYFQAVNQVNAVNVTKEGKGRDRPEHLYQDTDPVLESYFSGGENGGCCTANNGQGWPKYALRAVYKTPADQGIAVALFAPVRIQLGPATVLLVNTDYPFSDRVEVLVQGPLKVDTPLRVRIPGWAHAVDVWHNGVKLPASPKNGTMLDGISCSSNTAGGSAARMAMASAALCNITLQLNPEIRLESWYGSSVSVLRGPLLFSGYIGNNFTDYNRCEDYPYGPLPCPSRPNRPVKAGWFGVTPTQPYNLALVLKDLKNPASSFTIDAPGLRCRVVPSAATWPACGLTTPVTCVRDCDTPFNRTGFPMTIAAKARVVSGWGYAAGSQIEMDPPPPSPACAKPGACSTDTVNVLLVPHGATALRVGSFPVA